MDPKAALAEAHDALLAGSKSVTRIALKNYWAWRRRGGFQPILRVSWAHTQHVVTLGGDEYAILALQNVGRAVADMPAVLTGALA